LPAHIIGFAIRRSHHDVDVLGTTINGVKLPTANTAMIDNSFLNHIPLACIEPT